MGFDLRAEFIDNRTIEIECKWENPPFVSANVPEDVLVVRLNGPIYDQQDGLEIEPKLRTLRAKIPPQLTLGSLADAIEGAGDSL